MIKVGFAIKPAIIQQLRDINLVPAEHYNYATDHIIVGHFKCHPVAVAMIRPMLWVHGLSTNMAYSDRLRARATEALIHFSMGWGPSAHSTAGGLFQIAPTDARMEAICNSLGCEEEPGRTFRLDL